MRNDIDIVRESTTPRKRYRKTRKVAERLRQLADSPYDAEGNRLVLRMPAHLAHCVRVCAKDLNVRIQVSRFSEDDQDWIKVLVLQEGERSGLPGRPPVSKSVTVQPPTP